MAWEGAKADGFHNAHHVLCAWHKIHMGVHSLRLGTFPDKDKGQAAINEVKAWLNWFCTRLFILHFLFCTIVLALPCGGKGAHLLVNVAPN